MATLARNGIFHRTVSPRRESCKERYQKQMLTSNIFPDAPVSEDRSFSRSPGRSPPRSGPTLTRKGSAPGCLGIETGSRPNSRSSPRASSIGRMDSPLKGLNWQEVELGSLAEFATKTGDGDIFIGGYGARLKLKRHSSPTVRNPLAPTLPEETREEVLGHHRKHVESRSGARQEASTHSNMQSCQAEVRPLRRHIEERSASPPRLNLRGKDPGKNRSGVFKREAFPGERHREGCGFKGTPGIDVGRRGSPVSKERPQGQAVFQGEAAPSATRPTSRERPDRATYAERMHGAAPWNTNDRSNIRDARSSSPQVGRHACRERVGASSAILQNSRTRDEDVPLKGVCALDSEMHSELAQDQQVASLLNSSTGSRVGSFAAGVPTPHAASAPPPPTAAKSRSPERRRENVPALRQQLDAEKLRGSRSASPKHQSTVQSTVQSTAQSTAHSTAQSTAQSTVQNETFSPQCSPQRPPQRPNSPQNSWPNSPEKNPQSSPGLQNSPMFSEASVTRVVAEAAVSAQSTQLHLLLERTAAAATAAKSSLDAAATAAQLTNLLFPDCSPMPAAPTTAKEGVFFIGTPSPAKLRKSSPLHAAAQAAQSSPLHAAADAAPSSPLHAATAAQSSPTPAAATSAGTDVAAAAATGASAEDQTALAQRVFTAAPSENVAPIKLPTVWMPKDPQYSSQRPGRQSSPMSKSQRSPQRPARRLNTQPSKSTQWLKLRDTAPDARKPPMRC